MTSSKSDPKQTLLRSLEREHSKRQCRKIVQYVGSSQQKFDALMDVFFSGPYRITQRAAWPLSYCVEEQPGLIKPHIPALIKFLDHPGNHTAVKRNILRMFQFVSIPKKYHGKMMDLCFGYLTGKEPVAIQVFAMEVLSGIVRSYPELQKELIITLEEHLPYASAGYRSRALRILRSFHTRSVM